MYGLTDPFTAYCFDEAVVRWGTSFDQAIREATEKAKDQDAARRAEARVVRRWLRLPLGWDRQQQR